MTQLFAPRSTCSQERVRAIVAALLAAGFSYEVNAGRGGRFWEDAALAWRHGVSIADALAKYGSVPTWAVEFRKALVDGDPIEVTFAVDAPVGHDAADIATIRLSTVMPGIDSRTTLAQEHVAWSAFLAELAQPIYGWGGDSLGLLNREVHPVSPAAVALLIPQPIEWLNIFGPAYVRRLGVGKLLSAPAWRVELLANGGVGVILSEHPDLVTEAEARRVAQHIGTPGAFAPDATSPG